MIETNLKIINELKGFLELILKDPKLREGFSKKQQDFTRNRKLSFEKIALFLINLSKKSLSVELKEFFDLLSITELRCTKSALSQQRQKIHHCFFQIWNELLTTCFYHYYQDNVKRWKGFRLWGIDGSTLYLINKDDVKKYFGVQTNQSVEIPMARTMYAHDVLNDLTVFSQLYPITYSEHAVLPTWIEKLPEDVIGIYDRGFASFKIMYLHINQEKEKKFIIRVPVTFNNVVNEFVASGKRSKIVQFNATDGAIEKLYNLGYKLTPETSINVRLIRVELDNVEVEVLATNLYDEKDYPTDLFKEAYFKRWGVEINIGIQKNYQQMEIFSGQTVESIHQDFYAGIFTLNLHSLLMKQCDEDIQKINQKRKYNYKINRNVTFGFLKGEIVKIFLYNDPREIIEKLKKEFIKEIEPIRPNRTYPRKVKMKRFKGKYQTFTNYKRAI